MPHPRNLLRHVWPVDLGRHWLQRDDGDDDDNHDEEEQREEPAAGKVESAQVCDGRVRPGQSGYNGCGP